MLYHSTFPVVAHVLLFALSSKASVQSSASADIEIQPTSTIAATSAIASGNISINAIPVTTPFQPPANQNVTALQQYIESLLTSKWAVTVDVFSTDSAIESRVSVSWPNGTGPSPNVTASKNQWKVCAVYFADLVDYFSNLTAPVVNGSCFDNLGDVCLGELLAQASGRLRLNPGCGGEVEIPIPGNCSQISTNLKTLNLTTLSTSMLSSSPFIGITDPFDAANRSAVLSTAMQRVWPVYVIESAPNNGAAVFPGGCVQALNGTDNSSTIGASSSVGTGTASSSATSAAPAATSSTTTSAAMSYRDLERGIWSFGVLSTLSILYLTY